MTTTYTHSSVLTHYGIPDLAVEHPDAEVPVLTGAQRQGDVFLLPVTTDHGGEAIGAKGVVVVRAETDAANTHTLFAMTGTCRWESNPRAERADELVQGWLTVEPGGEAFLCHSEEHGAAGVGPGTYEVRRQREFAGEWRRVAD